MPKNVTERNDVVVAALFAGIRFVKEYFDFEPPDLAALVIKQLQSTEAGRAWLRAHEEALPKLINRILSIIRAADWSQHGFQFRVRWAPMDEESLPISGSANVRPAFAAYDEAELASVTRPSIERTERRSYLFRVTREARMSSEVSIHFVTDRNRLLRRRGRLTDGFGSQRNRTTKVTYGTCRVSFPASHIKGDLERPRQLFGLTLFEDDNRHVVLRAIDCVEEDGFFAELKRRFEQRPGDDVLLFVHGYNTSFDEAAIRAAQLKLDSEFDGPMILFSWPSKKRWDLYRSDLDQIRASAGNLRDFLAVVKGNTGAKQVHAIAHSLGSRVLAEAIELMSLDAGKPIIRELVLAAPDINIDAFEKLVEALRSRADRVTVYASDRETAASMGPRPGPGQPAQALPVSAHVTGPRSYLTVAAPAPQTVAS